MFDVDAISKLCRVPAGARVRLKDHDPAWSGDGHVPKKERKELAASELAKSVDRLAAAQELLYAANTWSVLLILQAMDTAGKDSTIRHVMTGLNPQGCQVHSFKHPSAEELEHNFLWRYTKGLPERGHIGIFNRSYYEEVLIVRVHPPILAAQRIPNGPADDKLWPQRFEDINHFERHLARNGTAILKFFLHISQEEQRQRLLERIEDPTKHWKFSCGDIAEREKWDDYMRAYEEALGATSTAWAPWYVVPADHKWVSRAIVAAILAATIEALELSYPETQPEQKRQLMEAKRKLEAEEG